MDKAIEAIPNFGKRIKLFTEKLRIAQYADNSIYDYRLKIAQAVLLFNKLPEEFTQTDIDYYLSTLLTKNRCSLSFFKHTVFRLQAYYKVMGLKQPNGLVLPKVRKPKRLPRVLSQEQIARLLRNCSLYDKTLLAIIYDCAQGSVRHEHIARYAYRVAITNSRILDVTDSNVSYDYKDYRKGGKHGVMTLYFVSFVAYFEIMTYLFVYNERGTSQFSHPQVATFLLETTQKPTSFPIIIRLHLRRQYNSRGFHITLQAIRSLSCFIIQENSLHTFYDFPTVAKRGMSKTAK